MLRNSHFSGVTRSVAPVLVAILGFAASAASGQNPIPIAAIQANPGVFGLQPVTVEGAVYIPGNYLGPGSQPSAYIQDTSGRGISIGVDDALLNTVGNVVRVVGEVTQAGTTVKILNATVTQTGSATPVAVRLSTVGAADSLWEGTFIEVHGQVTAVSGSNVKLYTVNDGSGPVVVRVASVTGAPVFALNDNIVARGAGNRNGTVYQILVGTSGDAALDPGGADTQPPVLAGAWPPAATQVRVVFSEPIDPASGQTTANYQVFETANSSNTLAVSSVAVSGPVAIVTLGGSVPFETNYTVRVSNVRDVALNTLAAPASLVIRRVQTDTTPPTLSSAASSAVRTVTATFSEAIDAATGGTAGNYSVFVTSTPATVVPVASVAVAGAVATLTMGADLAAGTNYTLRAQSVQDLAGNAMVGQQTKTFTTSGCGNVVAIAAIHADTTAYVRRTVTVQGQVYIPSNYRSNVYSGYIQDASGRGINLFGSAANNPLLFDPTNKVCVTGTVQVFGGTTVEVTNITTVELLSTGNPLLQAAMASTQGAANAAYEGTFVQVTGPVTAAATTGTAPNSFHNYTVNDGSGNVVVRVADNIGAPVFTVGQTITGRGAGSYFNPNYQILVGKVADIFEGSGGPDTTPPNLTSATNASATSVRATFSEAIDAVTGGNVANYHLAERDTPANTVAISSAAVSGAVATLNLGSSLTNGRAYRLTAQSIADLSANVMVGTQTADFTPSAGPTVTPIATIHADTTAFVRQVVTVEGQVYIPSNYRSNVTSGYIQDSSNRGINIFGSTPNNVALQNAGNIVRVTGTVQIFGGTTVEITSVSAVTVVSSGNPPLQPSMQSTHAAASAAWEGTYVQVSGPVTAVATTGTSPNSFHNYTVNDGSGAVVVRVADALGAAVFTVGQTIRGAGAGSYFNPNYQILVGKVADVGLGGGGSDTTPPTLSNASSTGGPTVQVNFSENIDPVTGGTASNYTVFETATPANTIAVNAAAVTAARATLSLASGLTNGTQYTVRVQGVKDTAGNTMVGQQTANFTPGTSSGVTPIATIQANPNQYANQTVTVQGQVYIPSNYRGTTTSGYIQDDSGRGINLFGSGANVAAAQNVGNIIRVTGQVQIFSTTTVEITNITSLTLVSSGNPPLCPVTLSTSDAAKSAWEGTFIEVRGTINGVSITGTGTTAAHNYVVDDTSGPITVRVVDLLSAPVFTAGQVISAKGAGSNFNGTFQILVGQTSAVSATAFPDACGPTIVRATSGGGTDLALQFSEKVQAAEANTAANYEVFRTNAPASTITVNSAVLQSDQQTVVLTLASALTVNLGYTVRVRNVRDLQGNAISATGVTRVVEESLSETVNLNGPPFTFLPRQGEKYPITFSVPSDAANGAAEIVVRIFDLQGRLKKTLFDSRFSRNAFTNNRRTEPWDGRDDVAQIVPAGTYVVHLLVTGKTSGERQEAQMPVVVATRLDR